MIRKANAVWNGSGRDGAGKLTTASGVLTDQNYGYRTRFESQPGTNPGGADRRGPRRLFHHGSGLPAAGRGLHPRPRSRPRRR